MLFNLFEIFKRKKFQAKKKVFVVTHFSCKYSEKIYIEKSIRFPCHSVNSTNISNTCFKSSRINEID